MRVLRRRTKEGGRLRILDVGCGDGLFFQRLAEFGEVEGLEPDQQLLDPSGVHASKIYAAPFDPSFRPGKSYDLLLMLDVLEHLDDAPQALACAHDLLESQGALLLTVPAFQAIWTNHDVLNQHRTRYRRKTLFPLLRNAGFSILESEYWFQWAYPVKFAAGLFEKVRHSQPSLPQIPPKWINRLLYGMSRLEQETLGASGIPFGSTLMAYCVRDPEATTR